MIETEDAQGRLKNRAPVAVVDIGSNSVRIVIYEGMVRAPAVLFNEKVSCGLGRGIARTGRMDDAAVERAIAALTRYRALADQARVTRMHVLATAAAREADNGPEFVARAQQILRAEIRILTGAEEARYSAFGVLSAFRAPDGIAGDLGGGSLELVNVGPDGIGEGATLPLGGIRLQEAAGGDMRRAEKIARQLVGDQSLVAEGRGRTFYAIGGTWRAIAKLHMEDTGYPLRVTHGYEIAADEALGFLRQLAQGNLSKLAGLQLVSSSRQALVPYGAAVLAEVIRKMKPRTIAFSALGVREGFLFSELDEETRRRDALIEAADELAVLRARSPRHARELARWTADSFAAFGIDETEDEARYRDAACRLADIGWRAHPDYRSTQSLAIIAYSSFIQISHQGRAYIALANYFRYEGLKNESLAPEIRRLTDDRIWMRAKYLGAFLRVAYLFTAAMPGVIGELSWRRTPEGVLQLVVPAQRAALAGERPEGRLAQLSKVTGVRTELVIEPAAIAPRPISVAR
ncbi:MULTISPECIES: Ppx/GppA phosphatase family protein [unclassified Roseitalea]|uniref:Ppx/GppA family phosphatase n=1 Tax=unclassified Roseitalea TaxID=2639107 RepID=UPI00273D4A05|nr:MULTISPECIES: Ppx/GppA phosphatase family protein [unclassified Roseitalea]